MNSTVLSEQSAGSPQSRLLSLALFGGGLVVAAIDVSIGVGVMLAGALFWLLRQLI